MKLFKDSLNTEKIQRPPMVVIVPRDKTNQSFLVDVKYADFTGTLDIPNGHPGAECYIVPPYKPLLYIGTQTDKNVSVDVYTLSGNRTITTNKNASLSFFIITLTSHFVFVESEGDTKSNTMKSNCPNLSIESLSKCKVMGPPVSYDHPVHPFFLTASRKPVNTGKK